MSVTVRFRIHLSVVTYESYAHAEAIDRKIHDILKREGIIIDTSGIHIEGVDKK